MTGPSRPRIAIALDTTDVATASTWAAAVQEHVDVLKLGLEFYLRNGPDGVATVRAAAPGCALFLDLKLHDIPATVAGAARAVAPLEPAYLTVHAAGGPAMVEAAATPLPQTRIAAVTVLTSLAPSDLAALALPPAAELAARWAHVAVEAGGARAIVCSAREASALRALLPGDVHLITPGIRPAGAAADDQSRVATPASAVAAGADVLVVGRPLTRAPDPAAAAASLAAEVADAAG